MTDLTTILTEALDDARKAEATYAAVLDKFGPVRPFINIMEAESRHSAAIERQMVRLGVSVPKDAWPGRVSAPMSIAEACRSAITAEIENMALYDRLLPEISDIGVRQVFETLQAASRDRHLPAFRRCLARQEGRNGPGEQGRRRGRP